MPIQGIRFGLLNAKDQQFLNAVDNVRTKREKKAEKQLSKEDAPHLKWETEQREAINKIKEKNGILIQDFIDLYDIRNEAKNRYNETRAERHNDHLLATGADIDEKSTTYNSIASKASAAMKELAENISHTKAKRHLDTLANVPDREYGGVLTRTLIGRATDNFDKKDHSDVNQDISRQQRLSEKEAEKQAAAEAEKDTSTEPS